MSLNAERALSDLSDLPVTSLSAVGLQMGRLAADHVHERLQVGALTLPWPKRGGAWDDPWDGSHEKAVLFVFSSTMDIFHRRVFFFFVN